MSEPENRSIWEFIITPDDRWKWRVRHPGGREQISDGAFETLKECADDASGQGWARWPADERRRAEVGADPLRLVPPARSASAKASSR